MEITVIGRHLDLTDAIREYATEKALKFPRYYDRVQSVQVIAGKDDRHSYEVELIVHVGGHDHFVARGKGDDLYACIDDTTDKIERQLTDHKQKQRNRKHSGPR